MCIFSGLPPVMPFAWFFKENDTDKNLPVKYVTMNYAEALVKINGDPVKANNCKNRFPLTLYAKHCILWRDSRRGNRWWVDKLRGTPWIAITVLK